MATARARQDSTPQVSVQEAVSMGRVGAIALIGFLIGVAWPRLAGVSLVPEAPVDEASFRSEPTAEPAPAAPTETEVVELTPEDRLAIGPAKVTSCTDSAGKKGASCDAPPIDEVVHPQLIALLGCPAATGVFGTLSLGFQLNFKTGKISDPVKGRSTELPEATAKELLLCAKKEFATLRIPPIAHEYSEYQVYYSLEFKTPEAAATEKTSVTPASGQATIQWRSAQIRKEPEQGADVQSRLLAGARVTVTGRMGEWYRVKYDARGREGWVHGAALGLK